MDLKRIEIEGFKSFAERTVIQVERGLTGIVGPNGCGKSNVIDAMLWVLGERSPRALRADSMEDVIFKGTDGRPAGAYAMVEIILCDEEGKVGEQGAEVAVGRRLFRSGEAEFLLNGRKVRRKDVREVLLDTGLGVRGYMVLAQGKIDAILAANPRDRRQVFEEAAGISRYRERKEESLRKLDGVGQNLARVEDVLAEVQKSVRSLRYQAGKARRFLETRDRYRTVRIRAARVEEARLQSEAADWKARTASLEQTIASIRRDRGEVEVRLQELEREAQALRSRHEELRREAAGLKERAAGLEERIHGLQARAGEMEGRLGRERERQAELNREKEQALALAETLTGEKAEAEALLERAKQEVADCEAAFEERNRARGELRRRMEELRGQVLEALGERTRWNNQREEAAHRRSECEGSLHALARRQGEVEDGLARLSTEQRTQEATLEQAEAQVASAEGRAAGLVRKRESLRQAAEQHAGEARSAGERAAQAQARLAALGSIEEERQDLPEHVRELLAAPPEGIHGLFLDRIRIAPPWDRLLENLLGRMQHALWADGRRRGKPLQAGTFDLFFPPAAGLSPVNVTGARPLRELLQGDADRCEALCSRLGEVYCVETGAQAGSLAEKHPGALFLSRDGELHGGGSLRMGLLSSDSAGILARRNAREEAGRVVAKSGEEEQCARREEEAAREALVQVEQELGEREADLREALARRDRARSSLAESRRRLEALAEERAALETEVRALGTAREEARRDEEGAEKERAASEARRQACNRELEQAEALAAGEEEGFEAARAALEAARMEAGRLEQHREHLQEREAAAGEAAARKTEEIEGVVREMEEIAGRIEELRSQARDGRDEVTALLEKRAALEARAEEAGLQGEKAARAVAEDRGRQNEDAGRLEELLESRQELALKVQRNRLQSEELLRGIQEEFQQSLGDLALALGGPEEEEASPSDGEALAAELVELRSRLEAVGSVNLEAVRELEEREGRAAFLEKERNDLVAARGHLQAVVEELDVECRRRFVAVFEDICTQFQSIFRRLFQGGRAEVRLTPDMDPLEAGVEVAIRPPGKKLRSINLLSGGERTLTALALLLGVFRARPSPFCLLDEVDAALDEANIERFLGVLEGFTQDTQFLVVTHNRMTMSRCARLFGVTMRRAGVSQVVGVEMEALEEGLADSGNEGAGGNGAVPNAEQPGPGVSRTEAAEKEMTA